MHKALPLCKPFLETKQFGGGSLIIHCVHAGRIQVTQAGLAALPPQCISGQIMCARSMTSAPCLCFPTAASSKHAELEASARYSLPTILQRMFAHAVDYGLHVAGMATWIGKSGALTSVMTMMLVNRNKGSRHTAEAPRILTRMRHWQKGYTCFLAPPQSPTHLYKVPCL